MGFKTSRPDHISSIFISLPPSNGDNKSILWRVLLSKESRCRE